MFSKPFDSRGRPELALSMILACSCFVCRCVSNPTSNAGVALFFLTFYSNTDQCWMFLNVCVLTRPCSMGQGSGAVVSSLYFHANIVYPGACPSVHLLLVWRLKGYRRSQVGRNRFGVSGKARRLERLCMFLRISWGYSYSYCFAPFHGLHARALVVA